MSDFRESFLGQAAKALSRARRDDGAPQSVKVRESLAFALPALEVVHSAIKEWKIKLVDTVTDNASSATVRTASSHRSDGLDLLMQGRAKFTDPMVNV
jgi:2-keto-4-pentenoate hydratase